MARRRCDVVRVVSEAPWPDSREKNLITADRVVQRVGQRRTSRRWPRNPSLAHLNGWDTWTFRPFRFGM